MGNLFFRPRRLWQCVLTYIIINLIATVPVMPFGFLNAQILPFLINVVSPLIITCIVLYLQLKSHGKQGLFDIYKIRPTKKVVAVLLLFAVIASISTLLIGQGDDAPSSFTFSSALFIITALILGPIYEENLFRGLFFDGLLIQYKKPWIAILLTSVFFGVLHIGVLFGEMNLMKVMYTTISGIMLGCVYYHTKSISMCIAMHITYNTMELIFEYVKTPIETSTVTTACGFALLIVSTIFIMYFTHNWAGDKLSSKTLTNNKRVRSSTNVS